MVGWMSRVEVNGVGKFAEKGRGMNELRTNQRYEAGSCARRYGKSLWTGGNY